MRNFKLILHQARYDQKIFWRDPAAVFFTVAFPVILLVIFVTIFGNETTQTPSGTISTATYYIAGIVALGVISATFVNLAISITGARESGLLKRLRSTPLPNWGFIAGQVVMALVVTALIVIVLVAIGWLVYGVNIPSATALGVLLSLLIGAITFATLGIALTALIPSENAAPAITNAIILPLYFISGVFIPIDQLPKWLSEIADIFPVSHFAELLRVGFDPTTSGSGLQATHVIALVIWMFIGIMLSAISFKWTPRAER